MIALINKMCVDTYGKTPRFHYFHAPVNTVLGVFEHNSRLVAVFKPWLLPDVVGYHNILFFRPLKGLHRMFPLPEGRKAMMEVLGKPIAELEFSWQCLESDYLSLSSAWQDKLTRADIFGYLIVESAYPGECNSQKIKKVLK